GRFEIAHCWAHVRRKFVEAEEVAPAPAKEALDLIGELYAAEKDCASEEDRRRIRELHSRDIVRRTRVGTATGSLASKPAPQGHRIHGRPLARTTSLSR